MTQGGPSSAAWELLATVTVLTQQVLKNLPKDLAKFPGIYVPSDPSSLVLPFTFEIGGGESCQENRGSQPKKVYQKAERQNQQGIHMNEPRAAPVAAPARRPRAI